MADFAEIEKHFNGVERTDIDFAQDFTAHPTDNPARTRTVRVF